MRKEGVFQERLRLLRQKRGVSQRQVAEGLGITEVGYQNYEVGRREPAYKQLIAIAENFDVSLDYLVGRTDNPAVNR